MSILTFTLHSKCHSISAQDGEFMQNLSFKAKLPIGDSLSTRHGKQIETGYVQLFLEKPKIETEKIYFVDSMEDMDTGASNPPSISFYAQLTPEIFNVIRDANTNAAIELRLQTGMMSAIQFNDSMGKAKLWDTSAEKCVSVESYQIILSQPENEG